MYIYWGRLIEGGSFCVSHRMLSGLSDNGVGYAHFAHTTHTLSTKLIHMYTRSPVI